MASTSRFLTLAAICVPPLFAAPAFAEDFQLRCPKPPFPVETQARSIDSECGNAGDTKTGAKGIQNQLKNNLCRTGQPTTLTFDDRHR
jgi:hypothetical protein